MNGISNTPKRSFAARLAIAYVVMSICFCGLLAREVRDTNAANRRFEAARAEVFRKENEILALQLRYNKANRFIAQLFGYQPGIFQFAQSFHYRVKITAYSLSPNETDDTPLMAAFGPSRPFMAALSYPLIAATGLKRGERFAIVSTDGEIRAVCVFWDHMSKQWNDMRVDIVAPDRAIALWHGIKDGTLIIVPEHS